MRTIIVGLGNPYLTDDGIGVIISIEVDRLLPESLREHITITEASVGGLRLMELLIDYDFALLVDAIISEAGYAPGHIHTLSMDDLIFKSPTQHSSSSHDTNLNTAIELGREMGFKLPNDILIYAIESTNVLEFSEQPTKPVSNAIQTVTNLILIELTHRYSVLGKNNNS